MYEKRGEWRKGLSCKKQTTTLGKRWSTKVFLHLWWQGVGDLGHQQHWIRARREELVEECATIICKHQFVDVTASQLQKHCNLAAFSTAMEKEVKVAKCPKLQMSTRNLHRCILAVHIHILSWFFAIMFLLVLQFSPLRLVPMRIHTAFFRTKME